MKHRILSIIFPLLVGTATLAAVFAPSALAQDKPITAEEVPQDLRDDVIDTYFIDNNVPGIIWNHYRTEAIIILVLFLIVILGIRNYAQNLTKQEQRLLDAMQSNAVIIFDKASDIRMLNRAAKQVLGLDEFVSMSEKYQHYFENAPSPEILEVFEAIRLSRHAVEKEVVFNHNKVMRTLIVKGYPLYSENRRHDGFLLIIADITEAIEKDRRVNWTTVAQHVAHKAKTPLSTINLTAQHLEMILSEQKDKPVVGASKYIDRIIGESRKLNEIVHNLTRLANKEQLNLLPNDVNILLQNIADEYTEKASRNVEIVTSLYRSLPKVGIDIAHFPEAIGNLMDNAIRAIGANEGRVIIATAPGQWIDRSGDYVEITIQDTGEGMSDEIKKSIFRPFSTHSKGGTGLGLVIVQKIVQEHYGEIMFNSSPGLGTTFQIRLPVTKY